MVSIVPLTAEHLARLALQPAQRGYLGAQTPDLSDPQVCRVLASLGQGWAVLDGERVLGCGGLAPLGASLAEAWALLAEGIGSAMIAITRRVRSELVQSECPRIEALVRPDHAEGIRWAELVGLVLDRRMAAPAPMVGDVLLYVRVR